MKGQCGWATAHWLRFADIETPDTLDLSGHPSGAESWKIGPDGPVGPDGSRLPSTIWWGVALYASRDAAERSFDDRAAFRPFLDRATENFHLLLQPFAHRGACNHLDPESPGLIFPTTGEDPGGALVVMTTAGFDLGPDLDLQRVVKFRFNVDRVREAAAAADGNLARLAVTPWRRGEDGMTMTVWRDDAAMTRFAYAKGEHRENIDWYKAEHAADRTSFTRFRALRSAGQWDGRDPIAEAKTSA